MTPSLYIVVPVLNEAENLPRLFQSFRVLCDDYAGELALRIILVDDGSTDGTADVARSLAGGLALDVLSHPVNYGPGRAFNTAFSHLAPLLTPQDWVLTMEGDNTSRHELVRTMLRRAQAEHYEVILASPYLYGGGVLHTSALRVILSKVANTFVKELLGINGIVTVSSFFRLYRASALLQLQAHYAPGILEMPGFECMVELVIKMVNLNLTISEVPLVLDTKLRAGKSKMKIMRTIRGYLRLYLHLKRWKLPHIQPPPLTRI